MCQHCVFISIVVLCAISIVCAIDVRQNTHIGYHNDFIPIKVNQFEGTSTKEDFPSSKSRVVTYEVGGTKLIVFENDKIQFQFQDSETGFGIRQIALVNELGSTYQFLAVPNQDTPAPSFWTADFRTHEGKAYTLDSSTVSCQTRHYVSRDIAGGVEIMFYWNNISFGSQTSSVSIHVSAVLMDGSPYAEFSLSVNLRDSTEDTTTPCLWKISFVNINNISPADGDSSQDTLLIPHHFGQLIRSVPSSSFEYAYPSGDYTMQFMVYCHSEHCLYYATHDPTANYKHFKFSGDNYVGVNPSHTAFSSMTVNHYLPNACSASEYFDLATSSKLSYSTIVGAYTGDWWDGTQIYREWALESAAWTQQGPLLMRTDIPAWFYNIQLWINSGWEGGALNCTEGDPSLVLSRVTTLVNTFQLPNIALHWYCWHEIPFDTDYPEYFPAKPGFPEAVRNLSEIGVKVFPYINGRLYDYNADSWDVDHAEKYNTKGSAPRLLPNSLQNTVEAYGSQQNFAVMCPTTKFWQNKIANTVYHLTRNDSVDGVYIDQIGAAYAVMCFDPSHTHTMGGGDYWHSGYQEMISSAQEKSLDSALVTESSNEAFMSNLSGYLVIAGFDSTEVAPVLPAVYGGYTLSFGRIFYKQDLKNTTWLLAKFSQMFVYGVQPGWFSLGGSYGIYDIVDPKYSEEQEFIRELGLYRIVAKAYFTYGKILRPIRIQGPNPTVSAKSTNIPSILATAWTGADSGDGLGIPLTNSNLQAVSIAFDLPLNEYELAPGSYDVFQLASDGTSQLIGTYASDTITIQLTLPARLSHSCK